MRLCLLSTHPVIINIMLYYKIILNDEDYFFINSSFDNFCKEFNIEQEMFLIVSYCLEEIECIKVLDMNDTIDNLKHDMPFYFFKIAPSKNVDDICETIKTTIKKRKRLRSYYLLNILDPALPIEGDYPSKDPIEPPREQKEEYSRQYSLFPLKNKEKEKAKKYRAILIKRERAYKPFNCFVDEKLFNQYFGKRHLKGCIINGKKGVYEIFHVRRPEILRKDVTYIIEYPCPHMINDVFENIWNYIVDHAETRCSQCC